MSSCHRDDRVILRPVQVAHANLPGSSHCWRSPMSSRPGDERCLPRAVPGVISWIDVLEPKGTDCRYLGDVLAGFCPVEVWGSAGQHDDCAGRVRLQLVTVEVVAQADVKHPGDDRVDAI